MNHSISHLVKFFLLDPIWITLYTLPMLDDTIYPHLHRKRIAIIGIELQIYDPCDQTVWITTDSGRVLGITHKSECGSCRLLHCCRIGHNTHRCDEPHSRERHGEGSRALETNQNREVENATGSRVAEETARAILPPATQGNSEKLRKG